MAADDLRPADLYEQDFYAWTQAQAQALRDRGQGAARLDWERLAEEIEDMGKSDLRECHSRLETIIEHLFKLAWTQNTQPQGGWSSTIARERNALEDILTPTLRRLVEQDLEKRHVRALRVSEAAFLAEEPAAPRDESLRWSLPQILGESDDPLG
ncbi:MAG: DUF29 family protein [Alphaproteobacteria bacterium]|nr:DUF29 family protein [Alphaproteobacteria bacterium]